MRLAGSGPEIVRFRLSGAWVPSARPGRPRRASAAALALMAALWPAAALARGVALVLGLGAYEDARPLVNAVNDAQAVADRLRANGIEVELLLDADLATIQAALDDFAFRAETADLAMIYYAGHGVQVLGENFLIPIDAAVRSNAEVQRQSVSLSRFLDAVSGARAMRIVVLDACRDNPFDDLIDTDADPGSAPGAGAAGAGSSASRGGGAVGLAPTDPERGTLVAFSTIDGTASYDGPPGGNSPFATAMIEALSTPGLEVGLLFRHVRDRVVADTAGLQEPYVYGSLSATPFYLAPVADGSVPVAAVEAAPLPPPDQEASLRTLADGGDVRAMVLLGAIHATGEDARFDPVAAADLWGRAAELGDAEGQRRLARMLEAGAPGVPRDPGRALALFQASADQGYAPAVNDLGFLHFRGELGLEADPAAAIALFARAAELGNAEALFNTAGLIDDGLVPGRTPEDAGEMLYRALRAGSELVVEQLSEQPESFKEETRLALQERLATNGFYRGLIDGDYGAGTQAAIREAYGLEGAEGIGGNG